LGQYPPVGVSSGSVTISKRVSHHLHRVLSGIQLQILQYKNQTKRIVLLSVISAIATIATIATTVVTTHLLNLVATILI